MVRIWSILSLLVACSIVVNVARAADEPKKHEHQTPEQRFDALEKAAKHDPLKGELTKDEFVAAVKEVSPKMADHAEDAFKHIKKADENKVTKDEYVASAKAHHHGGKGKKKAA